MFRVNRVTCDTTLRLPARVDAPGERGHRNIGVVPRAAVLIALYCGENALRR